MTSLMRKGGEKFFVDVYVQHVLLKKTSGSLEKDALLSLSIERGKHNIFSADKEAKLNNNGDSLVEFNESMTLEATLYSDGKGKYLEKIGKLMVRKKKKGLMSSSYIPIGSISLPLHELVHEIDTVEKTVLLENCRFPGSQMLLAISFRSTDVSLAKDDSTTQRTSGFFPAPAQTTVHSLQVRYCYHPTIRCS